MAGGHVRFNPCGSISEHYKQFITEMLPGADQVGMDHASGLVNDFYDTSTPTANVVAGCQ